ncbi:DNA repair protein RAD50.L-like [Saccoglossus kowalevskii]
MASVDKLSIQGIRSFGPKEEDKQVIKFFTPLTLIVGQNGAGKTTVIECLKYATTGDMPPGSRGQSHAFVHDPKIANELEVRGQVKLSFKDVNAKGVVVCRNIVATQKVKKVEFKTLESTLTRAKDFGEKVQISSKCADLNFEMIGCLGVSKAVLNNVIFCHQEEANWPLSESKALKTKFDEIFAATRYIKTLDHIRKFKQEQLGSIREYQAEIKYLKQNKEKATEIKDNISKAEARLAATTETVNKIKEQLEPVKNKLEDIAQKEGSIYELEKKVENLESGKEQMDRNQRELEAKIEHFFEGPTEELRRLHHEHHTRMQTKEDNLHRAQKELDFLYREIQECNDEQTKLLMEQGKLEQEAKHHQQSVNKRDSLMQLVAEEFGFEGIGNLPYSTRQVKEFMSNLKQQLEQYVAETKSTKKHYDEKESEFQKQIDDLRDVKTKLEHNEKIKQDTIIENKKVLKNVTSELDRLDASAHKLDELEEELQKAQRDLKEEEKNSNIDELKTEIRDLQLEKKDQENKLNKVNKELTIMTVQTSTRAELEMLQRDKRTKEEDIKRLKSKHDDEVKHLLGHFPTQNVRMMLSDYLLKQSRAVKLEENQLQRKRSQLSAKEQQWKMTKELLKKKEDELRGYEEKIFEVSGRHDFDQELDDLEVSIYHLQDEKGALKASEHLYGRYTKQLQKADARCPLCHRGFGGDQEVQDLIQELHSKLRRVPENLTKKTKEIDKQEKKRRSMLQLKPVKESMVKISETDIPDMKSKLTSLNSEIEKLRQEISEAEDGLSLLQIDESTAKDIEPDALMIDKMQNEISNLERKIQEKQSKLTGGDSGRTMQQVSLAKKQLEMELETLNRNLEHRRQTIQDTSETLQDLRGVVNQITHEKLNLSSQLQKSKQLEEKRAALITETKECQHEIESNREQLAPVERMLGSLRDQKRNITEKKETELEKGKALIEKVNSKRNEVSNLTKDIDKIVETFRYADLFCVSDKIAILSILNSQVRERELQDNLQLRKRQEEIKVYETQINELKENLEGYDYRSLRKEKTKLHNEQEELQRQKNVAVTRQIREDNEMKMYQKELQDDMYRDADEKFRNKMMQLETKALANSDLEKYYKALDRAVIKYHHTKMDEINQIMKELWKSTYKGNDIDAIEIRSDEEDGGGAYKRRNYNYRVVMLKGDTSLDMRGRCSAGQKVLASILIRLALAETFCISCGILALDEPTTNLDRENIESLAYGLVDIIKSRTRQSNFQLVVITHDEDFVELLGRSEYVEYFYRVQKNQNQLSTITKASVNSLYQNLS